MFKIKPPDHYRQRDAQAESLILRDFNLSSSRPLPAPAAPCRKLDTSTLKPKLQRLKSKVVAGAAPMSGRSVLVVFPEWRLCVCRRSWHVSPVAETPGRPHVGSPVCGVLLLSVFCAFMPNNLRGRSARHRCRMHTQRSCAKFVTSYQQVHRDVPRRLIGWLVARWLQISSFYTQPRSKMCYQTSVRQLSWILRLQL